MLASADSALHVVASATMGSISNSSRRLSRERIYWSPRPRIRKKEFNCFERITLNLSLWIL